MRLAYSRDCAPDSSFAIPEVFEVIELVSRALLAVLFARLGIYMVKRSFDLLQKGLITLQQVSPEAAVTVEFKKILKLQSRYPAMGFFLSP